MLVHFVPEWLKLAHHVEVFLLLKQLHVREVITPIFDVFLSHIEYLDLGSGLLLHSFEELFLVLTDVHRIDGSKLFGIASHTFRNGAEGRRLHELVGDKGFIVHLDACCADDQT